MYTARFSRRADERWSSDCLKVHRVYSLDEIALLYRPARVIVLGISKKIGALPTASLLDLRSVLYVLVTLTLRGQDGAFPNFHSSTRCGENCLA